MLPFEVLERSLAVLEGLPKPPMWREHCDVARRSDEPESTLIGRFRMIMCSARE
jgi:hypothetical protein